MKVRHFILSLALAGAVQAQTVQPGSPVAEDPNQIPSLVKDNFTREQPGDAGNWSKEGDNYRVEYVDKDSRLGHVIVYDRNGNVVRRDSELESVPRPINEFYKKNYPGETFRTWSAKDEKGEKYYYSNRQSEELRFNNEGKLVSPRDGTRTAPKEEQKKTR
jgi:hypothetical protein